jgi:hypothetical protein
MRQVCGFLQVLWFPPPKKSEHHYITEMLLKVALSTIALTPFVVMPFPEIFQD